MSLNPCEYDPCGNCELSSPLRQDTESGDILLQQFEGGGVE
jgi:hypothetical protein